MYCAVIDSHKEYLFDKERKYLYWPPTKQLKMVIIGKNWRLVPTKLGM